MRELNEIPLEKQAYGQHFFIRRSRSKLSVNSKQYIKPSGQEGFQEPADPSA